MNIVEVARKAKVSTATVSRALNGINTVNRTMARRVRQAAAELGYVPNKQARALVKGRSKILGLIVPEITNPFFPEVVQSFENIAVTYNYEILLTTTVSDPKRIEASVRRMMERRVDGIAVLTFGLEDALLEHLQYSHLPLVFVDTPILGATEIRVDYMRGIRQAVQHLVALRHKNIAFLAGPSQLKSADLRRRAFEAAIEELELDASATTILAGGHSIEGGIKALKVLLSRQSLPTAIMCSNDVTAIGVVREAYGRISIPSQLSLIGFDDIPLSRYATPPLTTIRMSQSELAQLAFNALVDSLEKPDETRTTRYLLSTELILRGTTALAPL